MSRRRARRRRTDSEKVVIVSESLVKRMFPNQDAVNRAKTDPYALVPSVTKIIRDLSAEQPVEQAATLEDVRMEVLARRAVRPLTRFRLCRQQA